MTTPRRILLASATVLAAVLLAAPASAAYLGQARLTVVENGYRPAWKLTYLVCDASGPLTAWVSEFTYRAGAKARTLDTWAWAKRRLANPPGHRCARYHSETYRSRFPQRAGWVTGVTLEIFVASGQTVTRTFRLNP